MILQVTTLPMFKVYVSRTVGYTFHEDELVWNFFFSAQHPLQLLPFLFEKLLFL